MLPIFASLLPGLISSGKKIISGVMSDVAGGGNFITSLKNRGIAEAREKIPGFDAGLSAVKSILGKPVTRSIKSGFRGVQSLAEARKAPVQKLLGLSSQIINKQQPPLSKFIGRKVISVKETRVLALNAMKNKHPAVAARLSNAFYNDGPDPSEADWAIYDKYSEKIRNSQPKVM